MKIVEQCESCLMMGGGTLINKSALHIAHNHDLYRCGSKNVREELCLRRGAPTSVGGIYLSCNAFEHTEIMQSLYCRIVIYITLRFSLIY